MRYKTKKERLELVITYIINNRDDPYFIYKSPIRTLYLLASHGIIKL